MKKGEQEKFEGVVGYQRDAMHGVIVEYPILIVEKHKTGKTYYDVHGLLKEYEGVKVRVTVEVLE